MNAARATRRLRGLGFRPDGDNRWVRLGREYEGISWRVWKYRRYRDGEATFAVTLDDSGFTLSSVRYDMVSLTKRKREYLPIETPIRSGLSLDVLANTIQQELDALRACGASAKRKKP